MEFGPGSEAPGCLQTEGAEKPIPQGLNRQRKELRFCVNAAKFVPLDLLVRICSSGAKARASFVYFVRGLKPASLRPCVSYCFPRCAVWSGIGIVRRWVQDQYVPAEGNDLQRGLRVGARRVGLLYRELEQQIIRPAYPTCAGSQDDTVSEQWAVVDDSRSSRLFFPQTIKSCPDTSCRPEEFFRAVTL
jgi:hypothetical protein